jgi:threonine dehydrogenase-like Zn-dependent dehydrogenase
VQQIVIVDVIEERLERAVHLGAALTINPAKDNLRAALEQFFGTVPRVVTGDPLVDCELYVDCAGHGPLLENAC